MGTPVHPSPQRKQGNTDRLPIPFRIALRQAYATAICSAAFLFREEQTGPLDDAAIATRLALWLWNSTPDAELLALATAGRLRDPAVLDAQVERLLADRKSDRFIADFLDQWLKLATIDDTTPDRGLYPEVAMLNGGMMPYVRESMVWEARAFLREMLDKDLPADNVIASDFAMLNGKLGELYGMDGVDGSQIRRVPLPADRHLGFPPSIPQVRSTLAKRSPTSTASGPRFSRTDGRSPATCSKKFSCTRPARRSITPTAARWSGCSIRPPRGISVCGPSSTRSPRASSS